LVTAATGAVTAGAAMGAAVVALGVAVVVVVLGIDALTISDYTMYRVLYLSGLTH